MPECAMMATTVGLGWRDPPARPEPVFGAPTRLGSHLFCLFYQGRHQARGPRVEGTHHRAGRGCCGKDTSGWATMTLPLVLKDCVNKRRRTAASVPIHCGSRLQCTAARIPIGPAHWNQLRRVRPNNPTHRWGKLSAQKQGFQFLARRGQLRLCLLR